MDIKTIISAIFDKTDKLLIGSGIIVVLLSFSNFKTSWQPEFPSEFNYPLGIFGFVLILSGVVFYVTIERQISVNLKSFKKEGIKFKFESLDLCIKAGRIEESICIENSGMVLPVNTTFVDDCRTDSKSAMGSIVLKYYPEKLVQFQKDIEDTLKAEGIKEPQPAETILMPDFYTKPCSLILTATTIKKSRDGIRSSPEIVSHCIQNIFEITADKKIKKLYIPVLGSGHGGLDVFDSLVMMLISIKFYSSKYHHIKNIELIFLKDNLKEIIKNLKILRLYRR